MKKVSSVADLGTMSDQELRLDRLLLKGEWIIGKKVLEFILMANNSGYRISNMLTPGEK